MTEEFQVHKQKYNLLKQWNIINVQSEESSSHRAQKGSTLCYTQGVTAQVKDGW